MIDNLGNVYRNIYEVVDVNDVRESRIFETRELAFEFLSAILGIKDGKIACVGRDEDGEHIFGVSLETFMNCLGKEILCDEFVELNSKKEERVKELTESFFGCFGVDKKELENRRFYCKVRKLIFKLPGN